MWPLAIVTKLVTSTLGMTTYGGVLTGSQLVNVACFLIPDVDARDNTVTHGFILVLAAGPYVQ